MRYICGCTFHRITTNVSILKIYFNFTLLMKKNKYAVVMFNFLSFFECLKFTCVLCFQISSSLVNRVAAVDANFNKEMELAPRVSPEFELTLDNTSVMHAVETMNFFQMKGERHDMKIRPFFSCHAHLFKSRRFFNPFFWFPFLMR